MSVVDDTRKVIQDFLAPELRSIPVRFDALEKRFDGVDRRLDRADAKFDKHVERMEAKFERVDVKLADADRKADRRHDGMMAAVAQMIEITMLRERVARLESGSDSHQ